MKIGKSKERKTGSLILSVILFVVAAVVTGLTFSFTSTKSHTGVESLALIVTLPLFLVYYIFSFGISVSSAFYGIRTATSTNKAYKITGIVFALLSVVLIALNIVTACKNFGIV